MEQSKATLDDAHYGMDDVKERILELATETASFLSPPPQNR